VNIVTTSNNGVAEQLLTDPRVEMISFTGSTEVGRLIQRLTAKTMKPTLLELGGKSAHLILDDADLPSALASSLAALTHSGQGCAVAARILVPRKHYAESIDFVTAAVAAVGVGDPSDPDNFCGPLISAKQRERVLALIETGKAQGARLTVGGAAPVGCDRGYFVAPTVFADVTPDMRIFQEEIFGPVLTITPYDGGDDEAVELANNSLYGLAGAVMGSIDRAVAVARRIRTASMAVNTVLKALNSTCKPRSLATRRPDVRPNVNPYGRQFDGTSTGQSGLDHRWRSRPGPQPRGQIGRGGCGCHPLRHL
jgi:aldehyde dehydrogenase (NAD+)